MAGGGDGAEDSQLFQSQLFGNETLTFHPYLFNYCCHGNGAPAKASNGLCTETQSATQPPRAHNRGSRRYEGVRISAV